MFQTGPGTSVWLHYYISWWSVSNWAKRKSEKHSPRWWNCYTN